MHTGITHLFRLGKEAEWFFALHFVDDPQRALAVGPDKRRILLELVLKAQISALAHAMQLLHHSRIKPARR